MINTWVPVDRPSDVEPGEQIRKGLDPYNEPWRELKVMEVADSKIIFSNGSFVLRSQLTVAKYWHKYKEKVS